VCWPFQPMPTFTKAYIPCLMMVSVEQLLLPSVLAYILSYINPIPILPCSFCMILFNVIFPSASRISEWPLSFRFPYKNPVYISLPSHICHMLHATLISSSSTWSPKWYPVSSTNSEAPHYTFLPCLLSLLHS
jgi:hypothetical protein